MGGKLAIRGIFFIALLSFVFTAEAFGAPMAEGSEAYRTIGVSPRITVWLLAQTHLWFAAFILAVPIFVLILEVVGVLTKDGRYDRLAREFIRVSTTAHIFTVALGIVFAIALFFFYPKFMGYMTDIFSPTFFFYIAIFLIDAVLLYVYCFRWKAMSKGRSKRVHILIGFTLNITGTAIMFIANAWTTFMMTPAGVDRYGVLKAGLFEAINNPLWHPMNLHRFIANIAFGGAIVAAYAAYRFLSARRKEERAHYDWMGYTASIISIAALLPLPFAGYWLTAEIYAYSQEMGMGLMGGIFGWVFVVQAVLIGALFLAVNYYLWCGLERVFGGRRYLPYVKYIAVAVAVSFLVWLTPHNPILSPTESAAMGGSYHPLLAPLGLMPAKNIAVNIMILATFISFIFYRRAPREAVHKRAGSLKAIQAAVMTAAVVNIIFVGVYYGYFADSTYKIISSVIQVLSTLIAITVVSILEFFIYRHARQEWRLRWGEIGDRSQYALILLAVSFTWLMGLMGFVRSAIRKHWHVYGVVRDNSPEAFTPSIQEATRVVSIGTLVFMSMIVFIFYLNRRWLGGEDELGDRDEL
ncbi:MAG: cytochrome ubiquinol oxidase subunit I [Deltaproteobacteria bacterium]|nr:cytochrome ubiquinol oxidase subunit I [Deltaproteobacteria bacterium]